MSFTPDYAKIATVEEKVKTLDPIFEDADIDDGDADTEGLPFEGARPSTRTAAMVTTAAPTRALVRSRWERRATGCGAGN